MKKFILTISFLLIGLFALGQRAEAQVLDCGPEYNHAQASSVQIFVDGCMYEVYICYECGLVDLSISMKILAYRKMNPNCQHSTLLTEAEIINDIENQMLDPNFVYNHLCINNPIEPCNEIQNPDYVNVALDHYDCYCKWKDDVYGFVWKVPCKDGTGFCRTFWRYCTKIVNGEVVIFQEFVTSDYFPDHNQLHQCPVMNLLPPDPVNMGEYSDCWHVQTECELE